MYCKLFFVDNFYAVAFIIVIYNCKRRVFKLSTLRMHIIYTQFICTNQQFYITLYTSFYFIIYNCVINYHKKVIRDFFTFVISTTMLTKLQLSSCNITKNEKKDKLIVTTLLWRLKVQLSQSIKTRDIASNRTQFLFPLVDLVCVTNEAWYVALERQKIDYPSTAIGRLVLRIDLHCDSDK